MDQPADKRYQDVDPEETQDWLDSLASVIRTDGAERAHFLLERMADVARRSGAYLPFDATTAYVNTISPQQEAKSPGDHELEWRLRSIIRWNAMAMVLRANRKSSGIGGHIASFASAATLYDVGFNHFWHAPSENHPGDLVYIQGHSSPGIYARAYLEGRLNESQLDNFRHEIDCDGLSSYPHPWLMPDFWQFPTVSMGLGPIMAIYQARFLKYLQHRSLAETRGQHVWAFMGDGEMDEPESLGAISLAGREKLDNLVFVVNCNLQRLDGPVRGNQKIIQELEGVFRGAGWNVIKVIWGSYWDPLLAKDSKGLLRKRMEEAVDGEYQNYKARDGGFVRDHFFGKYDELREMVANMTDEDIWRLNRGGHDPHKVYAAYHAAVEHEGRPTVILAKTVKGYGMGRAGEGLNITHQQKKMDTDAVRAFRDRFRIPIEDEELDDVPYFKPAEDSDELSYLRKRREELGGSLPQRRRKADESLKIPELAAFESVTRSSGDREISTTMAFVRLLSTLLRDKKLAERIVPIVADEARTFGMEGLFRQLGIYSAVGQLYEPVDSEQMLFYKEEQSGQILQEGITEAGAMSSWIAAATAYSTINKIMMPFFIFYSQFGFQRVGDLIWAAGDMRSRGFLLGGTAGRTTLNGEGLQHEDGFSQVFAAAVPNCISYDPTYAYEVAVIVQDGLRRMFAEQEDVFYYLTLMNENYTHPELPEGAREGILKGMYRLREASARATRCQLLGSGTILREVEAAAELLAAFDVAADVWSCTSFNQLARDGRAVARENLLHGRTEPALCHVEQCLQGATGPVIAASDYIRAHADQIREFVPAPYIALGTDGFGRSDSREALRSFFEVDRYHIAYAALYALVRTGELDGTVLDKARTEFEIRPDRPDAMTS